MCQVISGAAEVIRGAAGSPSPSQAPSVWGGIRSRRSGSCIGCGSVTEWLGRWSAGSAGRRVGLVTLTVGAGSGRSAGWSAPGVGCRFGGLHGLRGPLVRSVGAGSGPCRTRAWHRPSVAGSSRPSPPGLSVAQRPVTQPVVRSPMTRRQEAGAARIELRTARQGMLVSRETAGVMSRAVVARSRRSTWNLAGPLPWLCLAITRGWGWAESGFDGIVSPRARPFHVKQQDLQPRAKR